MKHNYNRLLSFSFLMLASIQLSGQIVISTQVTQTGCLGNCTGKIGLIVTGGVAPYTYSWSNGLPQIPEVENLCAGTYTVTVTDANGATQTATASVTQTSTLNLTMTHNNVTCTGMCNGSINLTVLGGLTPYSILWSNSATSEDLTAICAGTYSVTVIDGNGCKITATATVSEPPPFVLNICATPATCYGGSNGTIDLFPTGGVPQYTYLWSTGSTTQDLTNVTAGTYTPTVVDGNGCSAVGLAVVTQPTAITINSAVTNSSNGSPNGAIDLTVTGGSAPYQYNWSNGSNNADPINLTVGTYSVTVTDSHGCTISQSITVQGNGGSGTGQILLDGQVVNSGCGTNCTGSIFLSISGGSGNFAIHWTAPNGFTSTQHNISNLCAGTYCVFVTDSTTGIAAEKCFTVGQALTQNLEIQSSNAAFCNYNDGTNPPTCEMVCPHTTITYFVEPPLNCSGPSSFQGATWTISGAESYTVNPNGKEVVVTWGEAGPGLLTLTASNTGLCFISNRCITIVEEPVAKFSTDPPVAANATLQLCKGQTVSFLNESLNAEQFEWLFSDNLSTSTEQHTQHTFLTPGNFTVTLIARSNCLCADTTVLLIEVLDTQPPLLDCVGSVCPGETVQYSTSSNCSSYTWVVSANGTVVNGGNAHDNSITIEWGQGPVGTIALSASGCGGAACPQASVFSISIISDNAEIRGEEFVCPGSEETYTIDQFDGTEYTWSLTSGGSILSGQGTNKVTVAWTAPPSASATHWLIVDYYNCYLGCGGQDSIPVVILSPFFIQGSVEKCENTPSGFSAVLSPTLSGVNCNWVVYRENGTIFWTSGSPNTILNFPTNAPPGKYRIRALPATPSQTCSSDAELVVSVVARPSKPTFIDGPTVICPGAPLTYEVLGNNPFSVEWSVNNGTPASQMGNPVNVTWNTNANRWLSATYISTDGLGCRSDSTQLNVNAITVLSITGAPSMCEGTVGYYVADQYEDFTYAWEILPASAGAVKSGQGTNAVEIFWQTPGSHLLRVTTCGLSTVFNVVVWPNPEPIVVHPNGVCPGDSGLVLTAVPYIAYDWQIAHDWQIADGTSVSTVANALIPAGSYTVAVTDVHGCKGSSDFKLDLYPTPNVSVTTADPTGFCNNSAYVSITALVPDEGSFTFEWLHDGAPVGASNVVYVTNQYGYYTTVVTNQYGCKATAPAILLYNYCLGGGGGFCPNPPHPPCPLGNVQAVPDPTPRCDSILLVLNDYTGQYVPGSAQWWTGISGGAQIATATGDNASFIYPNAGKYIVIVSALMQDGSICDAIDSIDIEAVAQFSQRLACPGDSTRFIDESTRLPEANIVGWQWDFGEAGPGDTSTDDSPGYPYANAGNYTAMLTITTASGCTSTYAENVFVPNFPVPAFTPPLANCAGNAAAFALANPAGLVETTWDFGDPASGALNQSAGNPVYHNYSPAGNYPVTITATNGFGCTASTTHPVTITANPFTGNITPLNTVICEGQTITLVAPSGANASYVWSNGTNLPILVADHEGVYDVTLTNGNGCTYSPPSKTVDVNPAPVGVIKALELNDLGQVVGVSYPTVAVCAGEDVNLEIQDNGTYTYQWSGGNGTNEVLIFSEDRDNLLTIGTYTYTVTVTNPATGCTTIFDPFEVTVNPVPTGFGLATNNVCAGTPSTISYYGNQEPTWQVYWNTGETGPVITTEDAGLYFVRVVNEFGCAAQSNTVVIFPGPNVAAIPAGCHERCNPDTLCLPAMPDIVSWQWYYEGSAIPGATTSQFAATQSGTYYAELVDLNGCHAQSADLTVELYDGFGNILGHVWSDVNDNGVVDAADTLVALIPVQLWQNGTLVTGNISGQAGDFQWLNVLATGYTVQIDTQSLSAIWEVVIPSDSVGLSGCGGKVFANLLVDAYTCPPTSMNVALTACPGTSAMYNGSPVLAGQSQIFNIAGPLGCDTIVTVTVNPLPIATSTLSVSTCPGTTFSYQGVNLAVGQTQNFTLTSAIGCDSIVTVIVGALPTSASTLNVSTCPGTTYNYQGTNLPVGQTQNFTLTNAIGCDSIVTVIVGALPTSASTLNVSTCPGTTYNYQGTNLSVGQTQNFTLTNAIGCDSIVTVIVGALPTSASTLNVSTCPGTTYSYQGTNLSVGQTQNFTLTNAIGCDSIVTVIVGALPTSASTLNVSTCPGTTYSYQGTNLSVGQTQNFPLTNAIGCDSIVTVIVSALPTSASTLNVSTCPGDAYTYDGVDLLVGQTQDFTLANAVGCDSVVTVIVSALPTSTGAASFGVCPNETHTYQGQALPAGTVQDFTLSNWLGCDSIVTVTVFALPTSTGSASFGVCPNETHLYQGQALSAGTVQDFVLTNWLGCDSIVTVTIFEKATSAEIRDVTVCPGQTYQFNGETIAIGEVKDVHFSNSEQCDSLITIRVAAWPALDYTLATEPSCPTTGTGALDITLLPGGSQPTGYAINGGAYQPDTRFDALSAGNYTVTIQDENGCIFEKTAAIEATPNLELALPGAFVIPCDSVLITLAPTLGGDTTGLQLKWWNGARVPSITTGEAGSVWLEATNHCHETIRKDAEVVWADSDGEPINIYVPNIFAPAAKNVENTMFRAFIGDNLTLLDYRLEVYDRWGNMLFESEQPEIGWTGPFRGKDVEPGVYVWQLWVKVTFCGREMELYRNGDVTVER